MENQFNFKQQNKEIQSALKTSIESIFPIESWGKSITVENVEVLDELDDTDFPKQKELKLQRKSWEVPIYGDIIVRDSEGKVLSQRKKAKLGNIPKLTDRLSAVIDGNEYQVTNQLRRKSGVYHRKRNNGELEAEFNLAKGSNFSLTIDPEKELFLFNIRSATRKYHLWNILNWLGVTDSQMQMVWGRSLMEKNRASALNSEASETADLYKKLVRGTASDMLTMQKELREYFKNTKMDAGVTEITLGTGYDSVTGEALLRSSQKLLNINKGNEKQDSRDSLIFKKILGPDDQLKEYIKANEKVITSKLANALKTRTDARELIPANLFTRPIKSFFTTADLSGTPPQTNPIAMAVNARKTTPMGEGGIGSTHAITTDVRDFDPSQIGFLDGLGTPEGLKVGVNLGLASEVIKKGEDMATPVLDNMGKQHFKTPIEIYRSIIGFPDEFEMVGGKPKALKPVVKALKYHELTEVPASQVDYWFSAPSTLFDFNSNAIPFLHSTQGNRGSTAGRMLTQALPLDNPQTPLTVVKRSQSDTYEDLLGRWLLPTLEKSTGDKNLGGTVTKIDDDYIYVKDDKGVDRKIGLYKEFPLNQDGFLNTEPTVSVGDKISATQPLAKSNYTDNSGRLALGTNLTVAYLPYKGNSFEDGATITESAAKKLAHTTIHRENIFFNPKFAQFSLKKFKTYYPEEFTPDQLQNLDEKGVIKIGSEVKPGDPLAAFLVKRELDQLDNSLKKLNKALYQPFGKSTLVWESDDTGVVTDVKITSRNIDVYIKAKHEFKVADKISSRFGDKHIVGLIIPDEEAPHRLDGTPVDIMVNPAGVPGRMNVGQVLDSAAGKIAEVTGKPYEVVNFDQNIEDSAKKVFEDMKKLGIEPNEYLRDGKTGDLIKNPVFVGPRQYVKLRHIVDKKQAAHSMGSYDIDEQPAGKGAQKIGTLEVYGYLGHGARRLLHDATAVKGQKNEEYFRNLQFGIPPGRPTQNFMYQKLNNYLRAAGVDVQKQGHKLKLTPLDDESILALSKGELKDAGMMLQGKNLAPIKGGLFDPEVTGGLSGENHAHIDLGVKIPNPMMQNALKAVLDLNNEQYKKALSGEFQWEGKRGIEAMEAKLRSLDLEAELEKTKAELAVAPPTNVNKLNFKARVLQNLHELGKNPADAYFMSKALVIPPKFRPIIPMPSGDLMPADMNRHYRDVALTANSYKTALKEGLLSEEEKHSYKHKLYETVESMQGFTDPQTWGEKKYRGALKDLGHTKKGLIFGKAWAKRQDLSGRSTIVAGPSLGLDEVGIPEEIAKTVYKPFVVRELKSMGLPAVKALKEVQDDTPLAKDALVRVMDKKPVILNRAPSLHKHNVQAFMPKLVDGKDIKLNPMVVGGFNADFDGDNQFGSILIWTKNGLYDQLKKNLRSTPNYYRKLVGNFIKSQYLILNNTKINANLIKDIMAARFNENIQYLDKTGTFHVVNLQDFPYDPTKVIGEKDGVTYYAVPEGIKVIAMDEVTGQPALAEVDGWSVHKDKEIWTVELGNKLQIITDHDERAVYGVKPGELSVSRDFPKNSIGTLVPVFKNTEKAINLGSTQFSAAGYVSRTGKSSTKPQVKLTKNVGYYLGAICGDGWVDKSSYAESTHVRVNLASIHQQISNSVKAGALEILGLEDMHVGFYDNTENAYGISYKYTYANVALASWTAPLIGSGAENKHLPQFWAVAPRSFRIGLLSGLMDTDGSISVTKKEGRKDQLMVTYTTISLRLAYEVQALLRSLGVTSKLHFSKVTQADNDCWMLSISSTEFYKLKSELMLVHPDKVAALNNTDAAPDSEAPSASKNDLVPITEEIVNLYKEKIGAKRDNPKELKSLYQVLQKAVKAGGFTVSRNSAKKLLEKYPDVKVPEIWKSWVEEDTITWVPVVGATNTGKKETGYDLTVPGYETFMRLDGVVVSNTMSVHVPISDGAEKEAFGMLPSRILFKHGDNSLVPSISQDYVYGLTKLSVIGPVDRGVDFKSESEAKDKAFKERWDWTDKFTIKGEPRTLGQIEINNGLPQKYRDYTRQFKGKDVNSLLDKIAREESSDVFRDVIDHFKTIGPYYAYKYGTTLSITDLVFDRKYRDDIVKAELPKINEIKDRQKKTDALMNMIQKIEKGQDEYFKTRYNNLIDLVDGGALSKSKGGNVRQVLTAPGLVKDTRGDIIPVPILKSYGEGLTTFEYMSTLPGVRKGIVDKSINTQESGALNKGLLAVTRRLNITTDDCGTKDGLEVEVGDKSLVDRVSAETIAGVVQRDQLITPEVVMKAKSAGVQKILARSPITCEEADGICQKCYGALPGGKYPAPIGTAVGILEGQAVSEKSCNHKHSIATIKVEGVVEHITLEALYNKFDVPETNGFVDKLDSEPTWVKDISHLNVELWDGESWTKLKKVGYHRPDAEMVEIKTTAGKLVNQINHPIVAFKDGQKYITSAQSRNLLGMFIKTNKSIVKDVELGEWETGECLDCEYSEIVSVTKVTYPYEYVYDVETESSKAQYGLLQTHNTQLTLRSFHCIKRDSLIFVELGNNQLLLTFEELWDKFNSPVQVINGEEYKEVADLKIWDKDAFTEVTKLFRHKRHEDSPMVLVKTRANRAIISQDNHPHAFNAVKGLTNSGKAWIKPKKLGYYVDPDTGKRGPRKLTLDVDSSTVFYKSAKEITKRTVANETCLFPVWAEDIKTPTVDPYLLGMFIGEGSFDGAYMPNYPSALSISQTDCSTINTAIKLKTSKLLQAYKVTTKVNAKGIRVYNTKFSKLLYTLTGHLSYNKALPEEFRYWSDSNLAKAVCGIIDAEGSPVAGSISLEMVSWKFIQQLTLILDKLGIKYNFAAATVKPVTKGQSYAVKIYPNITHKALFAESLKMQNYVYPTETSSRLDRDNIVSYIKEIYFDDNEWVYDVETATHTLTVNGFQTHNSGGAAGSKSIDQSFPRVEQLLKVPEFLSGKATLSTVSGRVEKTQKTDIGGWLIWVGGKKHTAEPGRSLVVTVGQMVKKGDKLTDGIIKPQELSALKSHKDAQMYLIDELDAVYDNSFHRKTFETVFRGITDNAIVDEAPEDTGYLRGDRTSISNLKALNKERRSAGLDEIKYTPYLKSIDTLNVDQEDWFTRISTNRVKDALLKGVAKGQWANIAGRDPIPAYIYSEDFGDPKRKGSEGGIY